MTRFRFALLALLGTGCTTRSENRDGGADAVIADSSRVAVTDLPLSDASAGDAGVLDASADAAADLTNLHPPHRYSRVLIVGDSFVGLGGGLAKALRPRFEAEGAEFHTSPEKAIKIIFFAQEDHLTDLLKKFNPDLILLVLGGNDMFVPEPAKHAAFVRMTVRLVGKRECYWLGAPPWKKHTGMLQIIGENSGRCTFFDSSGLEIDRQRDHIHPTDHGGEVWADAFWKFFVANEERKVAAGLVGTP